MIQFLYQGGHGSHGPRAQALSNVTPGSRCGDMATTRATQVPGLQTLAFWGHGDSYRLCGKTPRELHEVIKDWKKVNPGLNTVELITTTPSGGSVSFRGDIAVRANEVVRDHPIRQWTMNYGYFNTLRNHLGTV